MDRDHPVSDEQLRRRTAILDAILPSELERDCNRDELFEDIKDARTKYVILQYSHSDNGNQWATLGSRPMELISNHLDEDGWYSPHEVWDLDTGEQLTFVIGVVLGNRNIPDAMQEVLAELDSSDIQAFLDQP
jgi:hypothetical protein